MKKLGVLIFLMLAAGPVAAQDEAAATPGFGTEEPAAEAADAAGEAADAAAEATDATAAEATEAADAATDTAAEGAEAAAEATAETAAEAGAAEAAAGVAEEAPADGATAEAVVVEETVEVEAVTEVAETEEAPAESAATEESDPWELYVGTDYVWTQARFSKDSLKTEFGGDDFDSSMVRARLGIRLFQKIGFEVQIGAGTDDTGDLEADEYSTQEFYGAYLVPTGVLFDLFEVGAAIGVAQTKLETATASETLSGVSFGVNIEVPVYTSDAVELRIGGGGSMFRAQNSAQISGYFAGLRVDFRI